VYICTYITYIYIYIQAILLVPVDIIQNIRKKIQLALHMLKGIFMYTFIYIHVNICVFVDALMHECIFILWFKIYTKKYSWLYICSKVCLCLHLYTFKYIHLNICVFVYTNMYVYISINIYTYMSIIIFICSNMWIIYFINLHNFVIIVNA
jgi:hypothetical protein